MRWQFLVCLLLAFVQGWIGFIAMLCAWYFLLDGLALFFVWFAGLTAFSCYATHFSIVKAGSLYVRDEDSGLNRW